jgi:hypothetical protein
MLEEINDIENAGEFKQLAPYITGNEPFPEHLMIKGACKWFDVLGYQVIEPNSNSGKLKRKDACKFLDAGGTFSTKPAELEDTILIYKLDKLKQISMIASVIVF